MTPLTTRFVKIVVVCSMLCGVLAFNIFSFAQQAQKEEERFDIKVRKLFFAGFKGDEAALAAGMKICEDTLAANPNDGEAMVWHGSGLYYRSWKIYLKGDKERGLELRRAAVAEMDKGVELQPNMVGVRVQRGAVMLGAFRSGALEPEEAQIALSKGISDYEAAYNIQKDTFFKYLGEHPRGELMLGLADAYSRLGNEQKAVYWFTRIQSELKGTPYELSANTWLKERKPLPVKMAGCITCHTGSTERPKLTMPVVPSTTNE